MAESLRILDEGGHVFAYEKPVEIEKLKASEKEEVESVKSDADRGCPGVRRECP